MRALPLGIPRKIIQNRDHVVIATEDAAGYRVIRLQDEPRSDLLRTVEGYSRGYWEGDSLVVETTHFRANDPALFNIPRPVVISTNTRVLERFTRVSESELFYQYTVEDDELYTEPWSAEFSYHLLDAHIYEYGCHEGNYSLPSILRGGQLQAAEQAAATN